MQTRKVVWCDIALKQRPCWYNNVHSNKNNIALVCRAMTELKKPTLKQLFELHARARGELVMNKNQANVVFSESEGTQFELDKIAAEYL